MSDMKIQVAAVAVSAAAISTILLSAGPASAHAYDGKDPYKSGCAASKVYTGKKASLKNEIGDSLGTVKLYYSRRCGTNWGEAKVSKHGTGQITVFTSKKNISFTYRAGNGGRHWGDMVYAPSGVCAKASATVSNGIGRTNKGSGTTAKACG
ncbi:DUF2690 domain-containing protein [Nonomuraea sp. KC401]|uniref:DUF2690 domain-containing protein n=2 Tax=Streptosporangiaceae TaxID=2004 RepID=A0A4R4NA95_9ACTN|nr:DUF2690 domain-containing protein [Nonomuraea longispora]TLF76267.1 DUF2690 domain-containing protein [Nonomuraea sp. KC401]